MASCVTRIEWFPEVALVEAVAETMFGIELVAVNVMKVDELFVTAIAVVEVDNVCNLLFIVPRAEICALSDVS